MKTNILSLTLAAVIAVGLAFPASAATRKAVTGDAPEITYLSRHTAGNPYDVRLLSWCGGLATRVEIVPQTHQTLVVAYNTGDLHGAKITGKAPSTIGFRVCKNGKTTVLFDLLSLEKGDKALSNLITRLSSKTEWQLALDLQNRGTLNTKTFAHTSLTEGRYASRF